MRTGLGEIESRRAGKYVVNLGVGGRGGKRGIFLCIECASVICRWCFFMRLQNAPTKTKHHEGLLNFWLMTRVRIL